MAGGLSQNESISAGFATNIQGAMGLVAAKTGLDLEIISSQMYAILVMVAITRTILATTFFIRATRTYKA